MPLDRVIFERIFSCLRFGQLFGEKGETREREWGYVQSFYGIVESAFFGGLIMQGQGIGDYLGWFACTLQNIIFMLLVIKLQIESKALFTRR